MYGDYNSSAESSYLVRFQDEVASYLGVEQALFCPSGVMAQQIALVTHQEITNNRKSFVCHFSSHLLIHEQNGYSRLLDFEAQVVPAKVSEAIQVPISYADVAPLLDAPQHMRPSLLIIEVPHREIGGKTLSWDELVQISTHCRRNGVPLHMDGARRVNQFL